MNAALARRPVLRPVACARRPPLALLAALAPAALVLAGCAAGTIAYQAPAADARASLRVDAPELLALQVHPDGERCGAALVLDAADDPLRRADHTLALPTGRPVALRLTWPHKYLDDCHAILSFTPVAGASYRLGLSPYVDHCEASVTPVAGSRTAPVAVTAMRPLVLTTSGCTR